MKYLLTLTILLGATTPIMAHTTGRNFEILVDAFGTGPQLAARGDNLTEATNPMGMIIDPAGPRNYINAIHGHFANIAGIAASATSPAFNTNNQIGTDALVGESLSLDLIGGFKYDSPRVGRRIDGNVILPDPIALAENFTPLPLNLPTENIIVTALGSGDTGDLDVASMTHDGSVLLTGNFAGGALDFDLRFDVGFVPEDTIYVLETRLLTSADVLASDSIFIVLSPDGAGPDERLHFESLHAESLLGIPEPTSLALLAVSAVAALRRRTGR